jgi:hypothetical protein
MRSLGIFMLVLILLAIGLSFLMNGHTGAIHLVGT